MTCQKKSQNPTKKMKNEKDLSTLSRSNANKYKNYIQLRLALVFGRFVHLPYGQSPHRMMQTRLSTPLSLMELLVLVRRAEHVSSKDDTSVSRARVRLYHITQRSTGAHSSPSPAPGFDYTRINSPSTHHGWRMYSVRMRRRPFPCSELCYCI